MRSKVLWPVVPCCGLWICVLWTVAQKIVTIGPCVVVRAPIFCVLVVLSVLCRDCECCSQCFKMLWPVVPSVVASDSECYGQ
jgi:hypothetical protein